MERFSDLKKIMESKDAIINKMSQLTDGQKKTAKEFFNKHNDFENEIDWNKWRTLTWDDLSEVIYKDRGTKSQLSKKVKGGIKGLTEGTDYEILAEGEFEGKHWIAYHPMTWVGSRTIASNSVPPVEEDGNGSAEWCTAYQKDESFWEKHSEFEEFIYLCGESIPTKKVALSVNMCGYSTDMDGFDYYESYGDIYYNIWDYWDENDTVGIDELPPEVEDLVDELYELYHDTHEGSESGRVMSEYGEDAYNGYLEVMKDPEFKYFDNLSIGHWDRWMDDTESQAYMDMILEHKEITLDFSKFSEYCDKDALIEHFGSLENAVKECQPQYGGTDGMSLAYGYLKKHGGEEWMRDCIDPFDFVYACCHNEITTLSYSNWLFMTADEDGNIKPQSL